MSVIHIRISRTRYGSVMPPLAVTSPHEKGRGQKKVKAKAVLRYL